MAWLTGTVADDSLTGGADSDTLLGLAGDDALLGGDGADYLSGDAGDDRLEGGAGADFLLDRSGTDTLLGGDGNDTIYALATAFIDGGAGADFLYGDGPDNTFLGGDGDDTISAGIGSTITGGAGRDDITLPAGFFNYGPGSAPSVLVTDFLAGALGDRLVFAGLLSGAAGYDGTNPFGTGYLQLRQDGTDTLIDWDSDGGGDGFAALMRLQNVTASALTGENLGFDPGGDAPPGQFTIGTSDNDTLTGGPGSDHIFGGEGADLLRSGPGVHGDTLRGGLGNDTLQGGEGDDYLSDDAGADSLLDLSGTNTLLGGDGNDTIHAGMGNATIGGGAGVDTLVLDLPRRLLDLAFSPGAPNAGLVSGTGVTYTSAALQGTLTYHQDVESFSGIEALHFADGRLVFDPGDPIGQVTRMYFAALGRAPDPIGLNAWASYVEAGHSIIDLAQSFVDSAEFQARYPAVSTSGFVTLLYENTLGRAPDQGGLQAWIGAMDGGLSRATMLTSFSECAEHYNHTAALWANGIWDIDETGASVARLYHAALGRAPDAAGWQGWTEQVKAGLPLAELAALFPASLEFQLHYPAVDNAGFVTLLYENTLGREPDQAGFDGWLAVLDAGTLDPAGMLLAFSESLEHKLHTVGVIEGGIAFI